jgi:hypothetical protein
LDNAGLGLSVRGVVQSDPVLLSAVLHFIHVFEADLTCLCTKFKVKKNLVVHLSKYGFLWWLCIFKAKF